MATNYTNRLASQSLKGQAVIVTVNSSDAANLWRLSRGQLATNQSSSKTGTVGSIDVYGTSFEVIPIQPDRDFASSNVYGYLAVGETVIINT